jgi:hypothetical protein
MGKAEMKKEEEENERKKGKSNMKTGENQWRQPSKRERRNPVEESERKYSHRHLNGIGENEENPEESVKNWHQPGESGVKTEKPEKVAEKKLPAKINGWHRRHIEKWRQCEKITESDAVGNGRWRISGDGTVRPANACTGDTISFYYHCLLPSAILPFYILLPIPVIPTVLFCSPVFVCPSALPLRRRACSRAVRVRWRKSA